MTRPSAAVLLGLVAVSSMEVGSASHRAESPTQQIFSQRSIGFVQHAGLGKVARGPRSAAAKCGMPLRAQVVAGKVSDRDVDSLMSHTISGITDILSQAQRLVGRQSKMGEFQCPGIFPEELQFSEEDLTEDWSIPADESATGTQVDSVLHGVTLGHGIRCRSKPTAQRALPCDGELRAVVDKIHDAALESQMPGITDRQLEFTRDQIARVRDEVDAAHAKGDRIMAQFSNLLMAELSEGAYEVHSSVIAKADGMEFNLACAVQSSDLEAGTLGLARRQLEEVMVRVGDSEDAAGEFSAPRLTDSAVEFEALAQNELGVHRVLAHARPARDLSRVIADTMFGVEHPAMNADVPEEEENMYQIRIIVDTAEHASEVHRYLSHIHFSDGALIANSAPCCARSRSASLVSHSERVAVDGQQVRASVIAWRGVEMSVRVQTLDEHYAERELRTMARRSRQAARRERVTKRLGEKSPVYGFSRDMLHFILTSHSLKTPPSCDKITVTVKP